MRKLVLYHANCPDGFAAAWSAWLTFKDDADYVPVQYGQEPPDVTGKEVYILDFSYKYKVMKGLVAKAESIVLLDHHRTAQSELEPLIKLKEEMTSDLAFTNKLEITFDMTKSGGRLAWEYFHPGKEVPLQITFSEDRDLWVWKLPGSREVNDAIASYPHDFEIWSAFTYVQLYEEGKTILRFKKQLIDSAVKNAHEIELAGYKVLSTNTTVLISEIGEQLCKDRPFSATYFVRNDGKKVWSLRSKEVDVSAIAKLYGGGGHRNAAGYVENQIEMVKEKNSS